MHDSQIQQDRCLEEQHHFNKLQQSLRQLAVTISVASGTVIGIVLGLWGLEYSPSHLNLMVAVILFFALYLSAMYVLWLLDQDLYQRLLSASFLVGLQLELRDKRLAPLHLMMYDRRTSGGAMPAALIYAAPILVYAFATVVSGLLIYCDAEGRESVPGWLALVTVLEAAFGVLVCWLIHQSGKHISSKSARNDYSEALSLTLADDLAYRRRLIRERLRPPSSPLPGVFGVVLTGGSRSGKSSLIDLLRDQGHAVIPQSATAHMQDNQGPRPASIRDAAGHVQFQNDLLKIQFAAEKKAFEAVQKKAGNCAPASNFIFLDRGALDGLAYLRKRLAGLVSVDERKAGESDQMAIDRLVRALEAEAVKGRKDMVFVLESIRPFPPPSECQLSSESESRQMATILYDLYDAHGGNPIWVPYMSPGQRLEFILREIRERQAQ